MIAAKIIKGFCLTILFLVCAGAFNNSKSQQQPKPPKPIDWEDVAEWKKKVEANPDSLSYHTGFIKSIGWDGNLFVLERDHKSRYDSAEMILEEQYKIWGKQFLKISTVHYAIGSAYWDHESPKATPYLIKTAELDPKNADALFKLSIDAERWGDSKSGSEFMRQASEADSSNPAYLFYYAANFRHNNIEYYRAKVDELVNKFPTHERAAQGLYWLAYETKSAEEKIKIYEALRTKYPPEKFNWSESGMYGLFEQYMFTKQYDKAIELSASLISKRGWNDQNVFAKGISKIQSLINSGEYRVAYDSITKIKNPRNSAVTDILLLMEAELADKTGNTKSGYEKLLIAHAKSPTDELAKYIFIYAQKIGKDEAAVNKDIWEIRNKTKKLAYPFDLGLYTSTENTKLSDYKGKVVLLYKRIWHT